MGYGPRSASRRVVSNGKANSAGGRVIWGWGSRSASGRLPSGWVSFRRVKGRYRAREADQVVGRWYAVKEATWRVAQG
jgi:hypothetical protein